MKKYTREELIESFFKLAKKLGKIPTKAEVQKFICTLDPVNRVFGNYTGLKEASLEKYPFLSELEVPNKLEVSDVDSYRINLEKNKIKKNNKILITDVSTLDYIAHFADKVFSGKIKPTQKKRKKEKIKRIVTLVLSDTHFGSDIEKEETGCSEYKNKQEARRLAAIVKQTIDFKPQYRKETKLNVILGGDLIQGQLHDPRDGAPLAEQVCRTIHLLSQAISILGNEFNSVEVFCTTGNHGRFKSRHESRAINQKWDSIETIVYYSIKECLKQLTNIKFNIPKTPYVTFDLFDKKGFATHGDTVLKPGFPGKAISIESLEKQINKINATLPDDEEFSVFIACHVHTASVTHLSNGAVMITNGMLVPPDEYAVSLGVLESNCGQWIFESVPGFAVGDQRFIRTSKIHDDDASLDKIIKPWTNLNE